MVTQPSSNLIGGPYVIGPGSAFVETFSAVPLASQFGFGSFSPIAAVQNLGSYGPISVGVDITVSVTYNGALVSKQYASGSFAAASVSPNEVNTITDFSGLEPSGLLNGPGLQQSGTMVVGITNGSPNKSVAVSVGRQNGTGL